MNRTRVIAVLCSAAFTVLLGGCGGGNSAGNATISGNVTGLATGTSVSLTNNGGSALVLSSNGKFTFGGTVSSNNSYDVEVSSQPTGQTCVITYGTGVINFSGDDISNVAVACTANIPIGVTVTGLNSGNSVSFNLTLQNDATNSSSKTVTADGVTNNFPVLLPLGTLYTVSVSQQPGVTSQNTVPTQVCTLTTNSQGQIVTPASGGVVNSSPIVIDFNCQ